MKRRKRNSRNGIQKPKKNVSRAEGQIPNSERVSCHYCGAAFVPARPNQKFCTPSSERKKNWQRKQALAGALARQFRRWGWRARNMLRVAQNCVEAAYEVVLKLMIRLGWKYDEGCQVWRVAAEAA